VLWPGACGVAGRSGLGAKAPEARAGVLRLVALEAGWPAAREAVPRRLRCHRWAVRGRQSVSHAPVPDAVLGAGQPAGMTGWAPAGLAGGVAVILPALFFTGAVVWYFFL